MIIQQTDYRVPEGELHEFSSTIRELLDELRQVPGVTAAQVRVGAINKEHYVSQIGWNVSREEYERLIAENPVYKSWVATLARFEANGTFPYERFVDAAITV